MNGPVNIPTIDQLLADPSKIATVPPDAARTLLCGLASLLPVLIAQASTVPAVPPATPERWLTVEQVVSQFGVTERWLYRNKRKLPHSLPSRKVLLFPEDKLRKWFLAHKAS